MSVILNHGSAGCRYWRMWPIHPQMSTRLTHGMMASFVNITTMIVVTVR